MRFCVVGLGFVGKAIYSVLSDKHEVYIIDPLNFQISRNYFASLDGLNEARGVEIDGFIICVPTPQHDGGRCDDTLVSDYVLEIQKHHPNSQILIKSTTSVETLDALGRSDKVTFSPEFLRGSVGTDPTQEFRDSNFAIFGGKGGRWWHEVLSQLMTIKEVRFLDIASAGFLKYSENAFLAMKVMFFNELEELYKSTYDTNWDAMIEALALDKRIGMSHTQVPGPDGLYGFGGHCLPKDTSEFTTWAREMNSPLHLLEEARKLNEVYRDK